MAKRKASPPKDEPSLSFEEALAELQGIVASLEEGAVGLEESLAQFEHGMQMLRHCHQVLESAEQRIEQLTGLDADGAPLTEAFDASATFETRGGSAGRRTSPAERPPTSLPGNEQESGSTLF